MRRLRKFYWQRIRRHDGEICQRCGDAGWHRLGRTYWFAPNALWNLVMGGEAGVLCPRCFTIACELAGIAIGWTCGPVGEVERDDQLRRAIADVLALRSSDYGNPLVNNLQAREMLQRAIT